MKLLIIILVFCSPFLGYSQLVSLIERGDTLFKVNPQTGAETQLNKLGAIKAVDTTAMLTPYLRTNVAASLYGGAQGGGLSPSDTASMLNKYLRIWNATTLYQPLGTTVRFTDSANMLSPYLRTWNATTLYQPLNTTVKLSDSAAMLSKYLRIWNASTLYQPIGNYQAAGNYVGVSDTATMLNKYLRLNVAASTYQPLGSYQASGSYLGTTDTTAMLDKYLREWDATTLYQPKGNYQASGSYVVVSDTAAMLDKYLREWDATTLYATIGNLALKANLASPSLTTPNIDVATGTSLTVTGTLKSSGTAGIGYATGAGGTITQATNKATGVTLNKITGEIVMNAAALAAGAIVSFTLTNSTIAATDVMILNHVTTGTRGAYILNAQCQAGTAIIYVRNSSAASLGEAIVIRFAVIKGVTN